MVYRLRGRRILEIHVGYQHTKYIWRKAKRTSERKSNWQQKYALGIPIKANFDGLPGPMLCGLSISQLTLPLDLVNLIGDVSIQLCFSMLS